MDHSQDLNSSVRPDRPVVELWKMFFANSNPDGGCRVDGLPW